MKQKNLILLVVAVGCGLLAAFLTTQMSAKPAATEQTEMIVAAKELTVGMKIEKDKLAELIKKKKVNKADIPLNAVLSEDELLGKSIVRNLRADDYISVSDVGQVKVLEAPKGKHLYTIKLPYESVGPWVQAGRTVDVVCTHKPPGTEIVRHIKLLPELLIMAVDVDATPNSTSVSKQVINTVTLAASLDESHWLQLAQNAGAQLRLLVRGPESETFPKLPDDELYALFNNVNPKEATKDKGETAKKPVEETPTTLTVRYPVSIKEAKAGQVIDDEFITKCMQVRPFAGPAPADVIIDLTAHKGKQLIKDIGENMYLTETVLGAKPAVAQTEPKESTKPVEVKKPVETWDQRFVTGSATKVYRFERFEKNGEWKYKGEVQDDGSVTPTPLPNLQPKPDAKGGNGDTGGKIS